MLLNLRKRWIGRWIVCALLAFGIGPGMALHVLADSYHAAHHHDHHAHYMEDYAGISFATSLHAHDHDHEGDTCSFDHEHDQSHAAAFSAACLAAPVTVADAGLTAEPVIYPSAEQLHPDSMTPTGPGKPPRLLSHI